jgi:O-6-methylguanine DNA methyltransferase
MQPACHLPSQPFCRFVSVKPRIEALDLICAQTVAGPWQLAFIAGSRHLVASGHTSAAAFKAAVEQHLGPCQQNLINSVDQRATGACRLALGQASAHCEPIALGTAFQLRVWQALCAIPKGQTTSYSAIAKQIGQPAAVRSVGTAIGKNPLAGLIPCHRVLRSDKSLGGYRWGLDTKQALLAAEAPAKAAPCR